MEEEKSKKKIVLITVVLIGVLSLSIFYALSFANEETITGEFICANKVYMPDNNIKLVIYFNETNNTKFFIFDDWDARHSIQLSNLVEGDCIKIYYKDYSFRDCREIVRIEKL